MKQPTARHWLALPMIFGLVACGTSPAPVIEGRWQPVNRFPAKTQAIPLDPSYVYYASPMDGTLKHMLTRWARDSNLHLSYQHTVDYTLHAKTAEIRTASSTEAVALLKASYAEERLEIVMENGRIVVRPMGDAVAQAPSGGDMTP